MRHVGTSHAYMLGMNSETAQIIISLPGLILLVVICFSSAFVPRREI